MATLSAKQIAAYALSVGLTADQAVMATAIALGESGGRTDAMGDTTIQDGKWGPSVGLWQVRSVKAEKGKGTTRDIDNLTAPGSNAMSMKAISGNGTNWQPWTIYLNGSYKQFLATSSAAVAEVLATPDWQNNHDLFDFKGDSGKAIGETIPGDKGQGPIANVVDGTTSALGGIASALGKLTSGEVWMRIFKLVVGVAMIAFGVLLLNRDLVAPVAAAAAL